MFISLLRDTPQKTLLLQYNWRNKMISKEKKIFLESFDRRNLKRNEIHKLMNQGLQRKMYTIRKMREESYQDLIDDLKKKKSFDKSLINQNVSPTSRSTVRSFKPKRLSEREQFYHELDMIIEDLDREEYDESGRL